MMLISLNKGFIALIIYSTIVLILVVYAVFQKKKVSGTELYIYSSTIIILFIGWLLYNKKRQHALKLITNIKKEYELVDYYSFKDCKLILNDNFTYEIVSLEDGVLREGEWSYTGEDEIEMILIDANILGLGKFRFK